jgi:hypothetical protein
MNTKMKILAIEKLLAKSQDIKIHNSSDPEFKAWKNLVERTFGRVFGEKSKELEQFNSLVFYYNPIMWTLGTDYSAEHLEAFNRDFDIAIKTINLLIEELKEYEDDDQLQLQEEGTYERIFISHSSKDKDIVEELIDIIESIGITPTQIFCSSFDGYGIPLGSNFLETIKAEINKNVLVLFILSNNFYESPISLCEMGATWVLAKDHIPVIIPPFKYDDVEGVIPLTQGLAINDELKLNLLRDKLIENFNLPTQQVSIWERKRDRSISRINQIINGIK